MLVITEPKSSNSKRSIAIPDFLIPYLLRFRGNDEDYVLSGSEKLVEPRTMQYRYKKLLEAAAVESGNYHQLRHTFATNCVENGYDAKTLSIVLGHSTIALTLERYVHPNRQYERRMMNSLAVRM
jgi:site-specific recombinase XerD